MSRQIGISKRVDFSEVADGWSGCHMLMTPITYQEIADTTATIDDMSNLEVIAAAVGIAKQHFLSGTIAIFGDKGDLEQVPMVADDIDLSRELTDLVVEAVWGVAPDPKDSSTMTATS